MEGQTQSNRNDGRGSSAQHERVNRSRGKSGGFYKNSLIGNEESNPSQQGETNDSNHGSQEKAYRQNAQAQRQQGNRFDKNLQRGYAPQNGESNGMGSQNPRDNSRPKNRRGKQNNQRDEGTNTKNYQKKDSSDKQDSPNNERHDNTSVIEKGQPVVHDPHRAQQIADAARIQQLIPSGISQEDVEKVERIVEVTELKFEEAYAALEENNFDLIKTTSLLTENNGKEEKSNRVQPFKWASVVKKGTKHESTSVEPKQHPKVYPKTTTKFSNPPQNIHVPENRNPVMDGFATTVIDPEEVIQNLTSAIQNQLQMIQEQTKLLTTMQHELTVITQSGISERQQLLLEQEELQQRKAQLQNELKEVCIRIEQVEEALEKNKKKKAEQVSSMTMNRIVADLLKKSPLQLQGIRENKEI